jgi:FdhE protein
LSGDPNLGKDEIRRAVALARAGRPAYSHLYDFLEALLVAGAEISGRLHIEIPSIDDSLAKSKWEKGSPLLNRWDFPIDTAAAQDFLVSIEKSLPRANRQLAHAYQSLKHSITIHSERRREFRRSLLKSETEPLEELLDIDSETDPASVLFLAVSAIKPSLELTARTLLETHTVPLTWLRGYCPVCGSLPSLLYVYGEGARKAFCSWCATRWDLHRLQCPCCENRHHESLGYIGIEEEPQNRIVYCDICKFYFKQIDLREQAYVPCLPLEEWTTLHLDLLARKAGWRQPPSQAPAVYLKTESKAD